MPLDRRAVKTLFNIYWTSTGWTHRATSPEDLAHAKQAGVMFDPVRLSHAQIVEWAIATRDETALRTVTDAFLASLSTRRLELRSALGSYMVLRHFPAHARQGSRHQCHVCGTCERSEPHDLNVLNFERLKWGGVRHDEPLYAALDLELLACADRPAPTDADILIFRSLLQAILDVPPETTVSVLHRYLAPVLRSNEGERDVLIGILAMCSILATREHPGYRNAFVPYSERERHVEMAYPACWWRGRDGVNQEALQELFGYVL